jgi:thiamine pyrophosphate-dependent acetolactate synthase large subunit-like protein
MMGAGELSTAAHYAARLCIIVFKDAKLQYLSQSHIWRISKRHAASQPLFDTVAIDRGDNAARSASGHLAKRR